MFKSEKKQGGIRAKKKASFSERFNKTMEAITFAESGEHNEARRILKDYLEEPKKILIVENDRFFSRSVMDYVIGLAERMGFEIVALNIIPLGPGTNENFEIITKGFMAAHKHQFLYFSNKCKQLNIRLRHLIKIGNAESCIKEVEREIKRIEFLVFTSGANIENGIRNAVIPALCASAS